MIAMRVLIYCRRETDLTLLQKDYIQLCQYAIQQQHQISSVLLELDAGIFARRLGIMKCGGSCRQGEQMEFYCMIMLS